MHPELRATLDRFIYEHAGIRHLLSAAPEGADTRVLEGTGWTTVQLVGHFAVAQEGYVAAMEQWLTGKDVPPVAFNPDASNAETMPALAEATREQVIDRYAASLRALFQVFHRVTDVQWEGTMGRATARSVFASWSQHQLTHIFPFVDVLPETRYDPVIVNWLARALVPDEQTHTAQRRYIGYVREYYARLAEEEGEEE